MLPGVLAVPFTDEACSGAGGCVAWPAVTTLSIGETAQHNSGKHGSVSSCRYRCLEIVRILGFIVSVCARAFSGLSWIRCSSRDPSHSAQRLRATAAAAPCCRLPDGHQRFDRPLGRPGDAAQDHRLDLGIREVRVGVALHPHKRAEALAKAEGRSYVQICGTTSPTWSPALLLLGIAAVARTCRPSGDSVGFVIRKNASSVILKSDIPCMIGMTLVGDRVGDFTGARSFVSPCFLAPPRMFA